MQHMQAVVCFATQRRGMSRFLNLSLSSPLPSPCRTPPRPPPTVSLLTKHFTDKMYLYAICFCAVVVEKIYKNCALFICGVALFCTHLLSSLSFSYLFSLYLYRKKGMSSLCSDWHGGYSVRYIRCKENTYFVVQTLFIWINSHISGTRRAKDVKFVEQTLVNLIQMEVIWILT